MHSRPTRCTKTLGISEDFEVLLSQTAKVTLWYVAIYQKLRE